MTDKQVHSGLRTKRQIQGSEEKSTSKILWAEICAIQTEFELLYLT